MQSIGILLSFRARFQNTEEVSLDENLFKQLFLLESVCYYNVTFALNLEFGQEKLKIYYSDLHNLYIYSNNLK